MPINVDSLANCYFAHNSVTSGPLLRVKRSTRPMRLRSSGSFEGGFGFRSPFFFCRHRLQPHDSNLSLKNDADILKLEMNLPKNIPKDLSNLLEVMVTDFSAILRENFVGIYLWAR